MRPSISLPAAVLLVVAPACSDDGNGTGGSSAGATTDTPATTGCPDGIVCDHDTCFWPAP